ncbi:molybdenum cofactor guanylyltransferase [Altererythrobacter arenosus]|uniref:Molybdenum cofactor guanylyltransferase n=1 Tax=Altererythrobacter arenosus TaxID=3032592 RepID=A0ABY8FQN1_9SPHN|nr:molybdenum cofactor guanylyltransferase [Altererythrobacter sp. CAU 1644]WFL77319.1 molybdenum cofactor guanylyltransferase [Altererythrobacter sp. CAU 1644]
MSGGVLGLVLAGGQSTRFGSDKAVAQLDGQTLLERAISHLAGLCDEVVVVGRNVAPVEVLRDWPRAGMGPLGGIAAGLRHADAKGRATVLSCGVDSVGLPNDLLQRLSPAPAYIASQPVIGNWPVSAVATIEEILTGDGRHSMRAFAEAIGARSVQLEQAPQNINTPDDLAELEKRNER